MSTVKNNLQALAIETLQNPRGAARRILDLPATNADVWSAFVASICLSVVLTGAGQLITPASEQDVVSMIQFSPFSWVAVLGGVWLAVSVAAVTLGRVFKGVGTVPDFLRLVAWTQMLMIALQAVQIVLLMVVPFLAVSIGLLSVVLMIWWLVNFTAEIHGFKGLGHAFLVLLLSIVLGTFVAAILFSVLGVAGPIEVANV